MKNGDSKIYLKESKSIGEAYIRPILSFSLVCGFYVHRQLDRGNSPLTGLLLYAGGCLLIFAIRILLSDNSTVYVDKSEKEVVFKSGNNKKAEQTKIKYEEIDKIVIIKDSKRKYSIDIYDNELNAYECFSCQNNEDILDVAQMLGNEIEVKIDDRTYELYYEGYRQRKI